MEHIKNSLLEAKDVLSSFLTEENVSKIDQAISMLIASYQNKGKAMACGNGGSMCDSMHFCEELTGRYHKDRPSLPALPMGDGSHMSCTANDYGFEFVFERYVNAFGKEGDVLLAISTSGNSANVIKAVQAAKNKGVKVILLSGKDGGKLKDIADLSIIVPSNNTARIQEIHIKCIHIIIEGVERGLFPDNFD
jgi:D-sedoheptulose 7-phosphate isomerase